MRQGSCGASGVSTGTIRPLLFLALPLQGLGGPTVHGNWTLDQRQNAQPANRQRVAAWAIALLEGNGETQMRRMEKDAARTESGAGGPLSKPHAAVKSVSKNSAVLSRTAAAVWTTVTCGIISLEALRRSALTQLV